MTKIVDWKLAEKSMNTALDAARATLDKAVESLEGSNYVPADAKSNLDAVVAASMAGIERTRAWNHEILAFAEASLNAQMAAGKAMVEAKSVTDALAVQRAYLKTASKDAMAQSEKLRGFMVDAANDVAGPIGKQAEEAFKTWRKNAA